ncbi:nicotinamide mononucleotide adenylyl transferase [Cryomyces antarcticus]
MQNGVEVQQTLDNYVFPTGKLQTRLRDSSKTPLVLVSCGSFSPITFLHLRMFEMARDFVKLDTSYEVVGGYLSPVGDAYKKLGLAAAEHRIKMCELAVSSSWITVDPWEPLHKEYLPTADVLDHFDQEINKEGGVETATGERKRVKVSLLAGADLMETMSTPGVWSPKDLDRILGNYGAFIIERAGTDAMEAVSTSSLQRFQDNINIIPQMIKNDVSSTKIRLFLKKDLSVRYLIPDPVVKYIEAHGLYEESETLSQREKGKSARNEDAREQASTS